MGDITQGASGTEQQFLDAIREENLAIKQAAASALRHYYGNSQVIQRLRQVAVQSDTLPLFKTAINSLLATVDTTDTTPLVQFAQQIMNQDTTGHKAVFVFRKLADHGMVQDDELVKNLALLIDDTYAVPVRVQALRLLIQVDGDQDRWANRIENLLADSDPRIRFLGVRSIANLDFLNAQELLKTRMLDEYDGRVFYEMRKAVQ
ncbi:MAG: hypothetical protein U5K69_17410 [Balneolaceae bacterium]|nr:hypothetical protein [Balneolaceae bacterium]